MPKNIARNFYLDRISFVELSQLFKEEYPQKLSYYLIGSCFAQRMNSLLAQNLISNRFSGSGTLYNPYSIANWLKLVEQQYIGKSEFIQEDRRYYSIHSRLYETSTAKLQEKLQTVLLKDFNFIRKASTCIVTLGTSWVYRHISSKKIWANCHKQANKLFTRNLLSIEDIQQSIKQIIEHLKRINQDIKIIFTISPIRHLRDNPLENSEAKARLLSAVHDLRRTEKLLYFPCFEIVMDELRDYRWFSAQLSSLEEDTVFYLLQRLLELSYPKLLLYLEDFAKIKKRILHSSEDPENSEKTMEYCHSRFNEIKAKYPYIDLPQDLMNLIKITKDFNNAEAL